jgi:hypothetical protein
MLKGLWPRLRYGHVEQRNGNSQSTNDFRAIVNYEITVL